MVRLAALLLLAACAADPLDAALLAVPPGGRVDKAPGRAARLERVETRVCWEDRAGSDVARDLAATLAAAGWRDVELADTAPGRITVTAAREGLGLTGVVEEAAPGCRGARARIGAHAVPPGARRATAGPGLRARISP